MLNVLYFSKVVNLIDTFTHVGRAAAGMAPGAECPVYR